MRARRKLSIAFALLALVMAGAGCPKKSDDGSPAAARAKTTRDDLPEPTSCAERARRLGAAVAKLNDPPRVEVSQRPTALVPLAGARYVARHLPLLLLRGKNLSLDGRELQSDVALDQLSQIFVDQLERKLPATGSTRDVLLEPTDAPPISRPAAETWRQTVASWLSKAPRALIKGKLEVGVAP